MSMSASAGTLLKATANAPATFDASGYNALSPTTVGEITSIAAFGAEWQTGSHMPLALRGTQKFKTSRDPGSMQVELTLDTDNAGQIVMKAAHVSTSLYSFLIQTPDGDKYYCQGYVTAWKVNPGSQSSLKTASATITFSTSTTDVDWVESLAA